MATTYPAARTTGAGRIFRAMRAGAGLCGLVWFVLLGTGCGSSEYNAQVERSASELRSKTSAQTVAEEKPADSASQQPESNPFPPEEEKGQGSDGTAIGNPVGLAPLN